MTQQSIGGATLPSTHEVLADHIYTAVRELAPAQADHVTGMLLNLDSQALLQMLTDKSLLQDKVHQSLAALNSKPSTYHSSYPDHGSSGSDQKKEELGEVLFFKVASIESELCAQITGMLLELEIQQLEMLVSDQEKLERAVTAARQEFINSLPQDIKANPPQEDAALGDLVYRKVHKQYPSEADRITGMLLEMEPQQLHSLLEDQEKFNAKMNQAAKQLEMRESPGRCALS